MAQMTVKDIMAESGVAFGTSGARGTVLAMTDRVCYGYTRGFLSYLATLGAVSYTHLRAHETREDLVCRLLLEK